MLLRRCADLHEKKRSEGRNFRCFIVSCVFVLLYGYIRTEQLLVKDVKTSKVQQIAREIGKQPVLSFGNSSGDVSMHNYALYHNRYKSAAFQLIADDDARDYGRPEKGPELRRQWEDMGFHVISMRDDWKTIYGENVVRTVEIHWYEDYADDKISEKTSGLADFANAA